MAGIEQNRDREKLVHLQNEIAQCRMCRDLFGFEPHPVIQGNQDAKIMQISQAPSKRVHETGKPFHDASGRTLRGEWYHIADTDFYNPEIFILCRWHIATRARHPAGETAVRPEFVPGSGL